METLKPLRVVSVADPALDWQAMALAHSGSDTKYANAIEEYRSSREPSMVREEPGKKLVWFTLRRLDSAIMDLVLSQDSEHYKYRTALKYAVTRIENLTGLDGTFYPRLEPEEERRVDGVPVPNLSERQMALIASMYVEEMGVIAFAKSFFPPTSAVCFPRPRSWELLLKTKAAQVAADAVRKFKEQTSDRPQEDAPKATSGDSGIAATATDEATGESTSPSTASGAPSRRRKRPSKKSRK